MMPKLRWLACAFACVTVSCLGDESSSEPAQEQGDLAIVVAPFSTVARGTNSFSLEIGDHGPASKIVVSTWMPSMGHGGPGVPTVVQQTPSRYRIDGVTFSMPGTWELRVAVTCASGTGQRSFRYEVP